ncbi:GIY-YIG nuclease [Candidatus Kuenenbacteria bacterium CG2_30_39_24]|uniref:GIY-YIG nuclease n=1 Tax=Candidatus Kuenenbacteria bacterium CG2_30_39_24 TaxID=1805236 RepID=A0A1J5F5E1_9BACT|nr:MAG: GIY-YIG nuclease [Candidatus Kuenenbacteria bacterium CG2_30_39_24]
MQAERYYYVYLEASCKNGTLYIGVTNNILDRDNKHKTKYNKNSFTAKYKVNILVYYETFNNINDAIAREKQLKNWRRQWKIELIEKDNPSWKDLSDDLS